MRKIIYVLWFLVVGGFWYLPAASNPPAAGSDVGFSIRFYEKKVYFLGDRIQVEASLTNQSAKTLRFKIANMAQYNLDFEVRTTTNLVLEHAADFTIERGSNQRVFFRELSLEPGEKYGFVVDLDRFSRFDAPGLYVVQALFYPELYTGTDSVPVKSNKLSLNMKPPLATAEERAAVEPETGEEIVPRDIAPDHVVMETIRARQGTLWPRFFLYMDLESIYLKDPELERVYRRSTQEKQVALIAEYKRKLMSTTIDEDINMIPYTFEIVKTTYTPNEATVKVMEKFKYPDYLELKEFTYYLKRRTLTEGKIWQIYDYEIRNRGTEPIPATAPASSVPAASGH